MLQWIAAAPKSFFGKSFQFAFKRVNRLGMYDFFWELIPGFDRLEVEKISLESSHAISGCIPYHTSW